MKTNNWLIAAMIFLGISIIFSGIFIGNSIKSSYQVDENEINEAYLLDLDGAAEYLGLSTYVINELILLPNELIGRGVPYLKIGSNIYFSKEALDQWFLKISEEQAEILF